MKAINEKRLIVLNYALEYLKILQNLKKLPEVSEKFYEQFDPVSQIALCCQAEFVEGKSFMEKVRQENIDMALDYCINIFKVYFETGVIKEDELIAFTRIIYRIGNAFVRTVG